MIPKKFRAWDKQAKNMLRVNAIDFKNKEFLEVEDFDSPEGATRSVMILPKGLFPEHFDLMQFTSLHDKNGKEIYEGDIIKNLIGIVGEIGFSQTINGYFTGFGVQYKGTKSHWGINPLEFEVIGNVHENPKLLEEKK